MADAAARIVHSVMCQADIRRSWEDKLAALLSLERVGTKLAITWDYLGEVSYYEWDGTDAELISIADVAAKSFATSLTKERERFGGLQPPA